MIPDEAADSQEILDGVNVATRILGFVKAPSLQQRIIKRCLEEQCDVSYYNRNRELLYEGLKKAGFSCIKPEGAFYLFVKSPVEDEKVFCDGCKKISYSDCAGKLFCVSWLCKNCLLRCI